MDKDNSNLAEQLLIREGKAKIHTAKSVFYNKVQEFNRDLSVLAVHTFLKNELWKSASKVYIKDRISILDALSASGLRSIRYSLECQQCSLPIEIFANDISEDAIKIIESNIELNEAYNVIVTNEDASMLMYKKKALNERISIIDLDPYGSPTTFLDSAIQTIVDGGLLMVTSTDMAVLCGNHGDACYSKYGSYPVRAKFCHEMALRIVIASVNSHAARYGRYVVPLLSLSIDFYVRIFFQVFTSRLEAQKSISKLSYIYVCKGCESFYIQPLSQSKKQNLLIPSNVLHDRKCRLCEQTLQIGGPFWSDRIHRHEFVELMQNELKAIHSENPKHFGTHRRMEGMLQMVKEELLDCPLYYQIDRLCSLANCPMPSIQTFRSILINGGYQVSFSHALKNSIKTNAPNDFIWCILQHLFKTSDSKIREESPAKNILSKNFEYSLNFDLVKEELLSKNLLRYQVNPEENWGPKSRPNAQDKQKLNQNKRMLSNSNSKLNDSNKIMKTCQPEE